MIRDGSSMKVIAAFESHGIAPHDLALLENDNLVAVANYGTTRLSKPAQDAQHPNRNVEPRLSLIELSSGKLLDDFSPAQNAYEVRHVAARDKAHLFAIGADLRRDHEVAPLLANARAGPADSHKTPGFDFAPAPLFAVRRSQGGVQAVPVMPKDPLDFREGQTVIYDPAHDEAIATFAASHTLAVVDARSFDLKRIILTDRFGLYFPRGLALHPDGRRYAVSGSWSGLFFLTRGTHEPDLAATWHEVFFHHSHMTAMPL